MEFSTEVTGSILGGNGPDNIKEPKNNETGDKKAVQELPFC